MGRYVNMRLADGSEMTPEVRTYLDECERILDEAMARLAPDIADAMAEALITGCPFEEALAHCVPPSLYVVQ